jgi:hypothetical protein
MYSLKNLAGSDLELRIFYSIQDLAHILFSLKTKYQINRFKHATKKAKHLSIRTIY